MNFIPDSVPERSVQDIQNLVEAGVREIEEPSIAGGLRKFLVTPRREMWGWDYSQSILLMPAWVVAIGQRYQDYYLVYSDYGFAPESPWGLGKVPQKNFGADYSWYGSLEGAFRESFLFEEYENK